MKFSFRTRKSCKYCSDSYERLDGCRLKKMKTSKCYQCSFIIAALETTNHFDQKSPGFHFAQADLLNSKITIHQHDSLIPTTYQICDPTLQKRNFANKFPELPHRTGETAAISWAQKQIQACNTDHQRCYLAPQDFDTPLRLLDIRGLQTKRLGMVKLFENLSGLSERPHYACLSYCWGGDQRMKLQESTHAALIRGISLSDLPLNLRQIILFVRDIGFGFLWIDALCIQQDSTGEKTAEISRMGQIYKGAKLTIALVSSTGVDTGVFGDIEPHQRSVQIDIPPSKSPFQGLSIREYTRTQHLDKNGNQILCSPSEYNSYPLLSRGWWVISFHGNKLLNLDNCF
jgi:Heterokaryon incompatibility protein (HET)